MTFNKLVQLIGFFMLSLMVLLLYGFSIYHVWYIKWLGIFFLLPVGFGLVWGIVKEGRHQFEAEPPKDDNILSIESLKIFAAVILGAVIAFGLKVDMGLGAVVGAGLTGLMAALVLPKFAVPIYCGAFVGMTSSQLFSNYGDLLLASAIAGLLYLLTPRSFAGFGGKLGTIAFAGTFLTGFGLKREFLITPFPPMNLVLPIVICAVAATALTYYLSVSKEHGPVLASGGTGLIGGLILPNLFPGDVGSTLAVMTICASFAGMSSPERIPGWRSVLLMGVCTGLIYILSMPLAGGAGGKLGTISFGVAVTVNAWLGITSRWKKTS